MTSEQTGAGTDRHRGNHPSEPASELERPEAITHADEVSEAERLAMEDEVEFAASERMTFFSDAVVAIAITLLALELPVPEGAGVREVLHSADEGLSEYLAFVISFFVIANHWRIHHRVFRYVNRVTAPVISLNIWWLFLIVITPFTTKLLSTGELNIVRFGTYAAVEAIQSTLFVVMVLVIMRSDFVKPGTDLEHFRNTIRRTVPVAFGFAVSIPVYPLVSAIGLDPHWSFAVWGILPTAFGFGGRLVRSRQASAVKGAAG